MENEIRVGGYAWALEHERGAEYVDGASMAAFCAAFPEAESDDFLLWEQGVMDARARVFVVDDGGMMSVSEAAEMAGVTREYIGGEIRRGKLSASKVGRSYAIWPQDFQAWMATRKNQG